MNFFFEQSQITQTVRHTLHYKAQKQGQSTNPYEMPRFALSEVVIITPDVTCATKIFVSLRDWVSHMTVIAVFQIWNF
jgi:hypothetical protein